MYIPLNYALLLLTKMGILFTVLDKIQNYKSPVLLHLKYVVSSSAFSLSIPLGSCLLPIELYKGETKLRSPVVSHSFVSVKLLSNVTPFRIM